MALEDLAFRLVLAIERGSENTAVEEIIRQRDEALEMKRRHEVNWNWSEDRRNKTLRELDTERRRTRALRAFIKRMKAVPHVD